MGFGKVYKLLARSHVDLEFLSVVQMQREKKIKRSSKFSEEFESPVILRVLRKAPY